MKLSTTIEFKSDPMFFDKERTGIKNNTVRIVDNGEDSKILSIFADIKFIRIVNTDDRVCTESFVRTLSDITRYTSDNGLVIYIFTWSI